MVDLGGSMTILCVFLGGGLGSLVRYGTSIWLRGSSGQFPLSTLLVNLLGCFLLGYLVTSPMFGERLSVPMRVGLTTGFLGGFTTFSTFGLDSVRLLQNGALLWMFSYTAMSVFGGFAAAYLGMRLASN